HNIHGTVNNGFILDSFAVLEKHTPLICEFLCITTSCSTSWVNWASDTPITLDDRRDSRRVTIVESWLIKLLVWLRDSLDLEEMQEDESKYRESMKGSIKSTQKNRYSMQVFADISQYKNVS
ncbi:hypothetical protein ACJX0J_038726, partial [Zea mays]